MLIVYISSGSIPSELGDLSKLAALQVYTNSLTGIWICMNILTIWQLISNSYCYGHSLFLFIMIMIMILESLLYEYCLIKYSGSIPSELGALSSLSYITLHANQLEGIHN